MTHAVFSSLTGVNLRVTVLLHQASTSVVHASNSKKELYPQNNIFLTQTDPSAPYFLIISFFTLVSSCSHFRSAITFILILTLLHTLFSSNTSLPLYQNIPCYYCQPCSSLNLRLQTCCPSHFHGIPTMMSSLF